MILKINLTNVLTNIHAPGDGITNRSTKLEVLKFINIKLGEETFASEGHMSELKINTYSRSSVKRLCPYNNE